MKPQRLKLESEALEEFRASLNAALEIVTCQLVKRNLKKGTVTAKVGITIEECTNQETGEIFYEMEIAPGVNMKVGASDKLDCQTKKAVMKPDRNGRPMIASEQIGMDELMQEGA